VYKPSFPLVTIWASPFFFQSGVSLSFHTILSFPLGGVVALCAWGFLSLQNGAVISWCPGRRCVFGIFTTFFLHVHMFMGVVTVVAPGLFTFGGGSSCVYFWAEEGNEWDGSQFNTSSVYRDLVPPSIIKLRAWPTTGMHQARWN
jgi:hypothetical protein